MRYTASMIGGGGVGGERIIDPLWGMKQCRPKHCCWLEELIWRCGGVVILTKVVIAVILPLGSEDMMACFFFDTQGNVRTEVYGGGGVFGTASHASVTTWGVKTTIHTHPSGGVLYPQYIYCWSVSQPYPHHFENLLGSTILEPNLGLSAEQPRQPDITWWRTCYESPHPQVLYQASTHCRWSFCLEGSSIRVWIQSLIVDLQSFKLQASTFERTRPMIVIIDFQLGNLFFVRVTRDLENGHLKTHDIFRCPFWVPTRRTGIDTPFDTLQIPLKLFHCCISQNGCLFFKPDLQFRLLQSSL